MIIFASFSVFALRIVIGFLIIDLLWKTKGWVLVFLKISLAIGLGLGISSLAYFFYLNVFGGKHYFIYYEIIIFIALIIIRYKKGDFLEHQQWEKMTFLKIILTSLAGLVFITSSLGLANYVFHRQEGDWDSWMIFNRTARFIYRGQELWRDAFSKDIGIIFHADYPPMLSLNIASGWETIGKESVFVPIVQSLLFITACVLVIGFALWYLKSITLAMLGVIFLYGTQSFIYEGGRQTADIPLAYFMLTSVVLYYLFTQEKTPVLIILSGFYAGLAAWTKNEGVVFVLGSTIGMIFYSIKKRSFTGLFRFITGLFLPFGVAIYFKFFIAPSSEFLQGNIFTQLIDISRHQIIWKAFFSVLSDFGPKNLVIFSPLMFIYLIFQLISNKQEIHYYVYILTVLLIQSSGYYFLYLISPYNLVWHTGYSISRLVAHLYPIFIFLILYISKTPEELFLANSE